jgi:hypothetical protein
LADSIWLGKELPVWFGKKLPVWFEEEDLVWFETEECRLGGTPVLAYLKLHRVCKINSSKKNFEYRN